MELFAPKTTQAEILSALSVALDLVEGQPEGHCMRTAWIALRIGEVLGLPETDLSRLYFAALVKDAGCSNNSARIHKMFGGDEHISKGAVKFVDWSDPIESLRFAYRQSEVGGTVAQKLRRMVSNVGNPRKVMDEVTQARCGRGAEIAGLLGFDSAVSDSVLYLDEHWDGNGSPMHAVGEEIPVIARILCLAQTFEVFACAFGVPAAYAMLAKRRGKWFDPSLVDATFGLENETALWQQYRTLVEQKASVIHIPDAQWADETADIDKICAGFARVIDAKSAFTGEHSARVTGYALEIGREFGMESEQLTILQRAGLLHDVGKLGVPTAILDKNGPLTDDEFSIVKRHPEFSERIISMIPSLQRVAQIAGAHHERLDGKGYYQGRGADQLDLEMRILAVADVFDALSAVRPYRGALPMQKVFTIMDGGAGTHLDGECIESLRGIYGSAETLAA
ncbi:MAG: HD domain-containing protein [Armatimonadetes bacterium]|nr:HD domain-containing protein [Armatimonadota bacterium]